MLCYNKKNPVELKHWETSISYRVFYLMKLNPQKERYRVSESPLPLVPSPRVLRLSPLSTSTEELTKAFPVLALLSGGVTSLLDSIKLVCFLVRLLLGVLPGFWFRKLCRCFSPWQQYLLHDVCLQGIYFSK